MGDVNTILQMEALTSSSSILLKPFFFWGGAKKKQQQKHHDDPPKKASIPKTHRKPPFPTQNPKVRQHSANTLASRAALTKLVRARRFLATYGGAK